MFLRFQKTHIQWSDSVAKIDTGESQDPLTWDDCFSFARKLFDLYEEPPYHTRVNLILLDPADISPEMVTFLQMIAFKATDNAVGVMRPELGGYMVYTHLGYVIEKREYRPGDVIQMYLFDERV